MKIINLNNIKSVLILKHRCFIHGHTISRKKGRHIRYYSQQSDHGFSEPHFFTIEDVSILKKQKARLHETRSELKPV